MRLDTAPSLVLVALGLVLCRCGGQADSASESMDPMQDTSCGEPMTITTDCVCNPSRPPDSCWEAVGSGWRRYREAACFDAVAAAAPAAYLSDEPLNVDFSHLHVVEWCEFAGGCTTGPRVDRATMCDSTATVQVSYENCMGCGTQRTWLSASTPA